MSEMIDLAEAQILGFIHAKDGVTLIELIKAMGLTKEEYNSILLDYPNTIKGNYKDELDLHFSTKT